MQTAMLTNEEDVDDDVPSNFTSTTSGTGTAKGGYDYWSQSPSVLPKIKRSIGRLEMIHHPSVTPRFPCSAFTFELPTLSKNNSEIIERLLSQALFDRSIQADPFCCSWIQIEKCQGHFLKPNSTKVRRFSVNCHSVTLSGSEHSPTAIGHGRWQMHVLCLKMILFGEPSYLVPLGPKYQEIITDPSYAGQFVLMTNPHIGNTDINFGSLQRDTDDEESSQCFLAGLIIRNLSIISTSNWRCSEELGDYLASRNIMGIYDVDTRAITRRLRQDGSLIGVLSTEDSRTDEELLEMSQTWDIVGVDLISGVSCKASNKWVDATKSEWDFNFNNRGNDETFKVNIT
ncbi:carbamoyl-phosphate synthase small chain [Striga asiatica]|uniref:Carbamoyl-phosphate synthase small chain n=1 Tax=Striga asiatica TaxID=4170 RepID=A0A5A7QD20_STRAF|nr:carbamoyl-phosphate synthase small chain [Striga asiatica]